MQKRRMRSLSVMMLAFFAFMLLSSTVAQARPLAFQSDNQTAVEGNSYVSPRFGYSVSWDDAWDVTDEVNDTDYNQLTLSNEIANVYFEGVQGGADVEACVEAMVDVVSDNDSVSNVEPLEDEDGPIGGTEDDRAWALYSLTFDTGNDSFDLAYYIDCRPIVEGESLLIISMETALDDLDSQLEPLADLLDGVAIDGSTGNQPDDTGDTGNNTSTDTDDLAEFIIISGKDIDEFWTREFPKISGGMAYTPPADVIAFDEEVDSACGSAKPMEVGPFYCPPDQMIYYDLEFAQFQVDLYATQSVIAVVMAHEIGHHIQTLMGWNECEKAPCLDPNELTSQEFELMADCFAGSWVSDAETRGRLGSFDVETNITQFAQLLGDDAGNNADAGSHGTAARRTYMFLTGYYGGVTECLTISAATDPARNGGANAGTSNERNAPEEDPTPEATNTGEVIAVGEPFEIELTNATLALTVTSVETGDSLGGGREAEGQFVVVFFSLDREAEAAGPFPYDSFIIVDSDGNEYDADIANTDAYLKTSEDFPNGVEEDIESGTTYDLAIVFDLPTDASGLIFGTANGEFQIDLEI